MGLPIDASLDLEQIATPGAPAAGITKLYVKSGGGLYVQQSTGVESQLGVTGPTGPTGATVLTPVAKSASYTAAANDQCLMTGANTVTLPSAPAAGTQVGLYALTANATFARGGTDTITAEPKTGLTTLTVPQGQNVKLQYSGGIWYVVDGLWPGQLTAARATYTTTETLTASVFTKIPFDVVTFDLGSNFDVTTNHRYNVPQAGVYRFSGACRIGTTVDAYTAAIAFYKNGTEITEEDASSGGTGGTGVTATDLAQCSSGDYLEMWVYYQAAESVGGSAPYCYMAVERVA
jgi:hypothetical protein